MHALQVVQYVTSLPKEEVAGSMAVAMRYPPDSATDADRVEWLQLNLLLREYVTVRRTADLSHLTSCMHNSMRGSTETYPSTLSVTVRSTHVEKTAIMVSGGAAAPGAL